MGGRIAVQAAKIEDRFSETGPIVRADAWVPRADRGTVLAVADDSPALVQVGDTVLFSPRAGADYELEGRLVTVLNVAEIQGVLSR